MAKSRARAGFSVAYVYFHAPLKTGCEYAALTSDVMSIDHSRSIDIVGRRLGFTRRR